MEWIMLIVGMTLGVLLCIGIVYFLILKKIRSVSKDLDKRVLSWFLR